MQKPIALFVGLRYLRARKGSGFVSFVTFASVIGVALGVATLIVVLSVMNGFEKELRERLLGLTSHASILQDGGLDDWPSLVAELEAAEDIVGAAPFIAPTQCVAPEHFATSPKTTAFNVSASSSTLSLGNQRPAP